LIPGDSPRNPEMSSVLQNAGGLLAIDGTASSAARFEAGDSPWIKFDFERSYQLKRVVIEWDSSFMPSGELTLSLSEFAVFDRNTTLQQARALPAYMATHISIPTPYTNRIELLIPANTAVRQAKLWSGKSNTEVRLREVQFISLDN
jgi:hypothetical protein